MVGWIGIVLGSLILLVIIAGALSSGGNKATVTPGNAAAGSTSAPEKPTATPPPGVGQPVALKNWDVTVVKVEKPGKTLQTSSSGTKDAVGQWIVLTIDLKNTGKENFGFNGFDFVLKDKNGASIKQSDVVGGNSFNSYRGGQAFASQIPPGSTVRAYVVFDVAADATDMKVEFQGNKQLIGLGF